MMTTDQYHPHNFSMRHLLAPIDCSMAPPPPAVPQQPPHPPSDVLDLCVRKRPRAPTPPASPDTDHHRFTPEQKHFPDPPHAMMCFSSPSSQAGSEMSSSDGSHCSDSAHGVDKGSKLPRPFKAYPKDPLSMAYGVVSTDTILTKDSADAYVEFRTKMMSRVQNQHQGTNIKMRRTTHQNATMANSDPAYWEKRRKNNEAAKRSRDARRAKEDEIAIRCAFLEQENLKLRFEMTAMRHEMDRMREVLKTNAF